VKRIIISALVALSLAAGVLAVTATPAGADTVGATDHTCSPNGQRIASHTTNYSHDAYVAWAAGAYIYHYQTLGCGSGPILRYTQLTAAVKVERWAYPGVWVLCRQAYIAQWNTQLNRQISSAGLGGVCGQGNYPANWTRITGTTTWQDDTTGVQRGHTQAFTH
jgi:hypothetical protein